MQEDLCLQQINQEKNSKQFHKKNAKLSYIFIMVSAICWVSAFIYPNEKGFHPWETNMIKAYPTFMVSYFICWYYGYSLLYKTAREFYLVTVRNLILNMFDFALAAMQFKLPLPILYNINNTCSVLLILIQFIWEGKKLIPSQKYAVILVFIGISMMTNANYIEPLLRPSYEFKSQFQNYTSTEAFSIAIWGVIFFIMVAMSSVAIYITNKIHMNVFQLAFHNELMLILCNSFIYTTSDSNHDVVSILWGIPFSSLLFTAGELLFIGSIHHSQNIGVSMLLGSSSIIVGYLWSVLRYHEQISIISIIGSIAIVSSIYKIFLIS